LAYVINSLEVQKVENRNKRGADISASLFIRSFFSQFAGNNNIMSKRKQVKKKDKNLRRFHCETGSF